MGIQLVRVAEIGLVNGRMISVAVRTMTGYCAAFFLRPGRGVVHVAESWRYAARTPHGPDRVRGRNGDPDLFRDAGYCSRTTWEDSV